MKRKIEIVATKLGISYQDITSKKRNRHIVDARTIAIMQLAGRRTNYEIAELFAMNHSAVTWHVKKYRKMVSANDHYFMDMLKQATC